MPQTPGVPDHLAPKSPGGVQFLENTARKAWAAFILAGGGSALASNIASANFSDLSLRNLWQGLVGGGVTSIVVYLVKNVVQREVNNENKKYGYTGSGTATTSPDLPSEPG